jgi:hypothetical protein
MKSYSGFAILAVIAVLLSATPNVSFAVKAQTSASTTAANSTNSTNDTEPEECYCPPPEDIYIVAESNKTAANATNATELYLLYLEKSINDGYLESRTNYGNVCQCNLTSEGGG